MKGIYSHQLTRFYYYFEPAGFQAKCQTCGAEINVACAPSSIIREFQEFIAAHLHENHENSKI